ncbi:lipase 1-like [Eupeodes corollae]|uniref:lipase 1-like n=1 Tax=Eupeodes corollae TaxID=290404 RepID=UPI00249010C7|nr:lipase 1-like [Eupeodes corollae]
MFLKIHQKHYIYISVLFIIISNPSHAGSQFPWPWNLFRKKVDHYDREIENKAKLKTDEWIKKANLPCEIYEVQTEDGYILVLYRIPKPGHQPILLVHGLLTSSLSFVMLGAENSLAFQLASSDYDVWLINTRGTVQSRNHTSLTPRNPSFWKFSFHEIGIYDLSATIDKVRDVTAFHQLIYIGHSQGATALLALCTLRPEYNDRVLLFQALAPIVLLRNFVKFSPETITLVKRFVKSKIKSKAFESFAQGQILEKCSINSEENEKCLELVSEIFGVGQYNQSLDPIALGTVTAGGSVQEIEHFLQILKSGDFVSYDRGLEGNLEFYHRVEPDGYNLTKITMPIILHYSRTDALATARAVHELYKYLPSTVGVYGVPADKFNHFDFIWSPSLRNLLNTNIVRLCEEFLNGTLKYRIE